MPSRLVPDISLLSRVSGEHPGGDTEGQKDSLSTGLFGRILSKQSCFTPDHRRAQGADVLGLMWLTKFSFFLPKIK